MAEYIIDVASQTSKLDWAFPFQRTGAFPIDRSAVFSSFTDAQNYALGVAEGEEAKDERKLGGTSYVGQIISVYDVVDGAISVSAYLISADRTLLKLASTTASGDIAGDISNLQSRLDALAERVAALENGKADKSYVDEELAKKADATALTAEAERAAAAEEALGGEIAKKADAEQVAKDIAAAIAPLAKADDVYKKTETYSKSEVESYVQGQIGSAGHLKRVILGEGEDLPAIESADADTIYMKKADDAAASDIYVEYMVINGAWEIIGKTNVDLTDYVQRSELDAYVKTEVLDGYVTDGELTALEGEIETAHKGFDDRIKANTESLETLMGQADVDGSVLSMIDLAINGLKLDETYEAKGAAGDVQDALDAYIESNDAVIAGIQNGQTLGNFQDVEGALSAKADSSAVYTKGEVDALLEDKASDQDLNGLRDIVNGKANAADVYTKTEIDGIIGTPAVLNEGELVTEGTGIYANVYTREQITDLIADITGGESAADVLAELNEYRGTNDARVLALEEIVNGKPEAEGQAAVPGLVDVVDGLVESQITGIKFNNADVAIVDHVANITYNLPIASASVLGGVKSSTGNNAVTVNADGTMSVAKVSLSSIDQGADEILILNGGTAK